ncbi:pyridoxal phosphate-dependent decarboxylase family protein [Pseudomarimonas salicorniae]|uniref:Pyridoxal-dependent decarboxylase n=1 Tax=Pseudomarimonas salicorniae TaxID=2933270 RepID=A0ABT0GE93_9GAMM|nr:pyridoxal-dependent decarboxylase [Lysobacter sp. CAU 1642]MCK7592667.1 pyridoxal-dependent decarboxylase [Lysobacter sp. CAU 1642]
MSDPALHPCFLGPYAENDALLEQLVTEFLRDHVYWRRNIHPEDPPAIPTRARHRADFQAFEARLRRELHLLSAALKRSVPFHSQRYLGHMVSDLLIPGLVAQILTLPYNPNNVSEEAAPVTLDMEREAGMQLAAMLGYGVDARRLPCAFGHLTSGGTTANFQALRLALALKCYPLALRAARLDGIDLAGDDLDAFLMPVDRSIEVICAAQRLLSAMSPRERQQAGRRIEEARVEQMGLAAFLDAHPALSTPLVLAPATAHYSWSKGMKLLGLGRRQLVQLPEAGMRICAEAADELIDRLERERRPVLLAVGILGSTEFGTIDPIDRLCDARDRSAGRGFGFGVHVDAAWGGYLMSLLRDEQGGLRGIDAVGREFARFPRPEVYRAMSAVSRSDSVTIDPHKLGYLPYGAGAFLCRDRRPVELLAEAADYVFDEAGSGEPGSGYSAIGRYEIEGSNPGAMAAAVCVTHRVMPLDAAHFGRIQAATIRGAEAFRDLLADWVPRMAPRFRVVVPFEPDCNLLCIALNPVGNEDLAACNGFMRRLQARLAVDPAMPRPEQSFYGSSTTLRGDALGGEAMRALLQALGIAAPADGEELAALRLKVLRHTLMNPFLLDEVNGINYLARYLAYLEVLLPELLETHAGR